MKRWTIKNTGTCTWPNLPQVIFVSGDEPDIVSKSEVKSLAPGETIEVRVVLRAPTTLDTYASVWQLQYGDGQSIGGSLEMSYTVGASPTHTTSPTPELTATPYQRLWMSEPPSLSQCNATETSGRIAWGYGGGPSAEYRFFYGSISPETELDDSYRDFDGFPHTQTYFTTSGSLPSTLPKECGIGESGRCGGPDLGYEIVWYKAQYTASLCP
jgi:hypothetical protein